MGMIALVVVPTVTPMLMVVVILMRVVMLV
jgi:hypothetical protein